MKAKRLLTLFTAVVFLVVMIAIPTTAATEVTIEVEAIDVSVGTDFTLKVKGTGNFNSFQFIVEYDSRYLTYRADTLTSSNSKIVTDMLTVQDTGESGNTKYMDIAYVSFAAPKNYANEELFSLGFTAGAAETTSSVTLRHSGGIFHTTGEYDQSEIDYRAGTVNIVLPPVAPTISGNVTINNTSPKVGDTLTASYTYSDANGDPEDASAQSIEWLVGGVSKGKTTKAGSYTVTKDDFGKTIVARVTPTSTVEPKIGTPVSSAATVAVAANPALISSVTNPKFTPAEFAAEVPVELSYNFNCPNGGADASDIAWTYEDGSAVAGTISTDKKTYTPSSEDVGKKIKVIITPKSDRNTSAGTAVTLVSASAVIHAQSAEPVASNVESGLTVSSNIPVTLSSETEDASVYYTTDGSDPTDGGILYDEPVLVDESLTLKTVAKAAGYSNSPVEDFTYNVDLSAPTRFSASSVTGKTGTQVDVKISLTGNTGMAAFKLLIYYDNSKLVPISVNRDNSILTNGNFASNFEDASDPMELKYITAVWGSTNNSTQNGELFTLTFEILADLDDSETPISIAFMPSNIRNIDNEMLDAGADGGLVNIITFIYGDVSGDDKLTTYDLVRLLQYLAEWESVVLTPAEMKAADVYKGDSGITMADAIHLAKYLAEVEGIVLGE